MKLFKHPFVFGLLVLWIGFGISTALLATVYADNPLTGQSDTQPPVFPANPLLSPAAGSTLATFLPNFAWAEAIDPESNPISYTLIITGPAGTAIFTTTESLFPAPAYFPNGLHTWTVQAIDEAGNASDFVQPPYTFTIQATAQVYLPILTKPLCPSVSTEAFTLIPIDGPPADHPDYLHGDLNLSLRGYSLTNQPANLINYSGSTDANAPQLAGLFIPNKFPGINSVYRVNNWIWECGAHGCPGSPLTNFPVTLMSLKATPGEPIAIPERSPNIYGGDYKALVLYAEEQRITLGYTRQDTVAGGYAVHIENICVDPTLLALYRSRVNTEGWRINPPMLPALRNNQLLGLTLSDEVLVAIRDRGTFMDPRSRKDWWPGY